MALSFWDKVKLAWKLLGDKNAYLVTIKTEYPDGLAHYWNDLIALSVP